MQSGGRGRRSRCGSSCRPNRRRGRGRRREGKETGRIARELRHYRGGHWVRLARGAIGRTRPFDAGANATGQRGEGGRRANSRRGGCCGANGQCQMIANATTTMTVTNRARTNMTTIINAAANAVVAAAAAIVVVVVVTHAQRRAGRQSEMVVLLLGRSRSRQGFHFGCRALALFCPFGVREIGQSGQSGRFVSGRIAVGQG